MSNKNTSQSFKAAGSEHVAEYGVIKHDLVKVVILNAVYLAAIVALYLSNKQSGFLEKWFAKVFNF
ncbi:MAG: hypothetical protein JNN11_00425 [Candidatus Doudnabacteria bacterium]|nr:hypothetical protein [Candidatus Doudnabacteria bacterium]